MLAIISIIWCLSSFSTGSVAAVALLLVVVVAVGSVIITYKWHSLHHKNQTTQSICYHNYYI